MSVHGFGLGASVVGGFSDAHKSAIKAGFPDTIDTYGLVSGLWTSVFAFGAFIGLLHLLNFDALTSFQDQPLEESCLTQSLSAGQSSLWSFWRLLPCCCLSPTLSRSTAKPRPTHQSKTEQLPWSICRRLARPTVPMGRQPTSALGKESTPRALAKAMWPLLLQGEKNMS